jgi:hypothetical protein
MKIIKLETCPPILSEFSQKITIEYTQNLNQFNKILCEMSKKLNVGILHPKIFFVNFNTIFSFEFIPGQEKVLLGELNYSITTNNKDIDKYIEYLVSDPHRVWSVKPLTYDNSDSNELSNQVLTLLRLCKVNKDDYLKNPNVLSQKFKK